MLARTRLRVTIGFAAVGFCITAPPILELLFAAAGILTFLVCPPTIIDLLLNHSGGISWKFFLLAAPLNALMYGAVGYAFCLLVNQRIDAPIRHT
jgi:hypothetical protein